MRSRSVFLRLVILCAYFLIFPILAAAQQNFVRSLVDQPVDETQRFILKGNTPHWASSQFEVGTAPPDLPMERMLLVLKRSPEQDSALLKLLDDQQDKSSANYHKWLTPEQFGRTFGPSDADIQAVTSWLQSNGFQAPVVSKGRVTIEFSGTAGQVQQAFHTAIRKYQVNGESHWANANDPEIPAALTPVVAGIHTLHNHYFKPQLKISKQRFPATVKSGQRPQVTFPDGTHALAPADYQVIYNAASVLSSGISGGGETIAVVGRSNLFNQGEDVADFRSTFGVCCGNLQIILNGPDPGDLGGLEEGEATLDSTWSGALAPSAQIDFVVSAGTNATDGIFLSEEYIIDNDLAPVMTESFGGCESGLTSTQLQGFSAMAEQAAAQGITYILSTGDSGAEGCDSAAESAAQGPVSVSALAATPFTVAVGGTMFNENGHDATYWNTTNGAGAVSARSYIPENVWNESCASTKCGSNANLSAGGGGASSFFEKPSWQSGVSGIPSDGVRDLPDVALAAAGHDPYLLCLEESCVTDSQGNIELAAVSGTSASAPSFAGIMALVNQKTNSRQGQANYVLYKLAATETLSHCNGSLTTGLPASTCIFNDITVGNNAVPGETGFGTATAKYQSTVGYDLATGLGSVNVTNLVNQWSTVAFRATTTTLTLTPATLTHGSSASVSVSVAPSSGTGTPTGDVSLQTPNFPQGVTFFTLSGGGNVSGSSSDLPGGAYGVHAHYAGDGTFAPSDSAPTTITVSPEASKTKLAAFMFDQNGNLVPLTTVSYGQPVYLRADVSGLSGNGVPTGSVVFEDYGSTIVSAPYALNSEGTATTAQGLFTIPVNPPYDIVAQYQGDTSFNSSASIPVGVPVTLGPTTTVVTASSAAVTSGTPVTLSAAIHTSSLGLGPSGTVTFFSDLVPIATAGNPAALSGTNGAGNIQSGAAQVAQGNASLVVTLPAGQHSIIAQYNGDANYSASTAGGPMVTVQADFGFAASPASISIASPGASATTMLTVTGQPGYTNAITFSAASCAGLPRESTCSFNPATVTGSGSTTLTISTAAAHSAKLDGAGRWAATLGLILGGVFLLGGGSIKRCRTLSSMIALAFLVTVAGCGGGSSSGSGGNQDPGTPAGTSNVTVTATGGAISHTTVITLNVK